MWCEVGAGSFAVAVVAKIGRRWRLRCSRFENRAASAKDVRNAAVIVVSGGNFSFSGGGSGS